MFDFYLSYKIMKNGAKKYLSLVGILLLILIVWYLWYRSFIAYWWEHQYYNEILSSRTNWWVVIAAVISACVFPLVYRLSASKIQLKKLVLRLGVWAWVFWLVHSLIKWDPIEFWNVIVIFNTILLFALWIYLICWFAALWSWIERRFVKFKQIRRQEILLSFGLWMCGFIIIVQILLWLGLLYGIVSRLLFLWLGFMVRYERKQLKDWWDIISWILEKARLWKWKASGILMLVLILISLSYIYMWIQNAFTPYSTAWDANHEYMYIPKILAENAWIYRWNTVGNNMPGLWHQFLAFIFSLTWCTNGWLWLSSDNIAISMNNMSASFVLIFWIAIIFQIFAISKKSNVDQKLEKENTNLKKWKNQINVSEDDISNWNWITIWRTTLLLWLTSWMGAFLVIVDNKTDLWVMALSLLALLAGLIFLQNRETEKERKELLKYIVIAWLFFWLAALAKITAFVDFALFGLLLVWLWFSPLTSLWLWVTIMWLVRKFNILTSSVMLTNSSANWFILVWLCITVVWLALCLSKQENRKNIGLTFSHLITLWICFLIPFVLFKLPWTTISQIKTGTYSVSGSLKNVFLSKDIQPSNKLLAQNMSSIASDNVSDSEIVTDIEIQDLIDENSITIKNEKNFAQCSAAGNIYSEDELNEDLQEIIWDWASEDLWRYIWYWWKQFTQEKNWMFRLLKLLWPTRDECYWLNYNAKVLCNNAGVIDSFKIDDLRAIYENWIKDQDSEAWVLLKNAIDSYDEAKRQWKVTLFSSNVSLFYDEIVSLRQYYQSHSILSNSWSVYLPYRYIVSANISFNWSLQNLSSYYTDIGFVRIIIYIFLIVSLPYAIIKKDKFLTSVSLITLIGWGIWWIIWSAILWYGTVLISWTMITLAIFWDKLLTKNDKYEEWPIIVPWILVALVWFIFLVQIVLNFVRIASQWAGSVFVRYKWNVGNEQIIDENLEAKVKTKYWYWWKDIFNLQFPQYNPIIHALANRNNEDWVIVAWTYIQYFLWNQRNIKWDWMLSDFRQKTSDWDLCKTYWRLKNDNTRYLIIDPNIWTVTMWEWNESLFYRFFGKLNSNKTEVEIDWAIVTLVRLARSGYIKLLSTNNIWAKYAFTVDDDMVRQYFGWSLTDEQLILTRAKMAVLQYFEDADTIFQSVANMFMTRVIYSPQNWIQDIADVYWIEINSASVANLANKYVNWQSISWEIENLSQDERAVLINYINIYMAYQKWDNDSAWAMAQNLLVNSVSGGSQIIALELN